MVTRQTDKRDRLIQTAVTLVYQQGFHQTTLAQIARQAQVPAGTMYYFFKTKEALGEMLVEWYLREYREQLQQWDNDYPDPRIRLETYLQAMLDTGPMLARHGCPHGTLCSELHKQGGPLAQPASGIYRVLLKWLTTQFRLLGKQNESEDLALHLLSVAEGATVLTQSFQSSEYFAREVRRLKEWVAAL
jgi:TetR/AcrR family transcriptional regulator, transcriptional repressor for nem operon